MKNADARETLAIRVKCVGVRMRVLGLHRRLVTDSLRRFARAQVVRLGGSAALLASFVR